MRAVIATMLLALLIAIGVPAAQVAKTRQGTQASTWGMHGVALFGGVDGFFASHLPLFHAPHDYHVVISLRIADALARYEPVGQGRTWFLVNDVLAHPDFDQIAMLSSKPSPTSFSIPVAGITQPADSLLAQQLPARAKVISTVYCGTEDLQ